MQAPTVLLLTALAFLASAGAAAPAAERPADFHVAPNGRDDNPGTADKPFATIARARDAVRRRTAAGLAADVTVRIRGGTYRLGEPLVFAPQDGGDAKHSVTYAAAAGENVVLSGGRFLRGWKRGPGGTWTVELPRVKAGEWHFRQLFVGGRRAVRARTPNADAEEYCYRLKDAKISRDLKTHTLTLPPGAVKAWTNLEDVEAIVLKNWANLRKRVLRVEPSAGLVVLRPPHVKYFGGNRPRKGGGCFFENSPDMLDAPAEWYLDRRTGVLTYRARTGEDMARAEAVAPVLTHVLELAGREDRPVRNLHFRGLTFSHTHLPLPPEGHHGRQAAFRYGQKSPESMPCAVRWLHAEDCSLVSCVVAHVGGGGIYLRRGCRRNRIEGNTVFDAEGNGIDLGGPNDPKLVPVDNRIANNHVHHCGRIYYGACAVWVGFAQKTEIVHNLVHDHPYTGISIGWRWNPQPTAAREYVVARNHVYDVMKRVCDGGAIYSLGYQPGTVLRENHLHDVRRCRYAIAAPNNGIFLDEGSKGFVIERNVIYKTSGKCVRHNRNRPTWHTWKDNLFDKGPPPADHPAAEAGLEAPWPKKMLGSSRE